jgi:nucleoside-diphosphate-sugar epimerase
LPRRGDVFSTVFDTSLMRNVLGTWTFVPLEDGLRREIMYFKGIS